MVKRLRGYEIFLGILIAIAGVAVFQILVGSSHAAEEPLGVKRGEWLLVLATCGLWYATARLVKGAEKTAERQLRAYVHVTRVSHNTAGGDRYFVQYENRGQTPAHDIRVTCCVALKPFPTESEFFDQPLVASLHGTLGPSAEMHFVKEMGRMLRPDVMIAIRDGQSAVWIFGKIDYVDAFKKSRTTSFRNIISKNALPGDDGRIGMAPEGNEAD